MNVFEAVKGSVTTRQAAEMYGIQVRRNGMACCPFHKDKNPNMKVDKRFHCFGCQADGDVIDFTAQLFGIDKKDAAEKLDEDFGIHYDRKIRTVPKPIKRKIIAELQFRQAVDRCYQAYCGYLHLLEQWQTEYAPHSPDEEWDPRFVEALQKKTYVEYLLDTLLTGTAQEQAEILTEHGREVPILEQRIRDIITAASKERGKCSGGIER